MVCIHFYNNFCFIRRRLVFTCAVTLFLSLFLEKCIAVIVADIDWGEPPSQPFCIPRHAVMPYKATVPNGMLLPIKSTPMATRSTHPQDISFLKHIRVIFFDTNAQEFVYCERNTPAKIYYFSISSEDKFCRTFSIPDWFMLHYNVSSQHVSIDLSSFKTIGFASKMIRFNSTFILTPTTSLMELPFLDGYGQVEGSEEIFVKRIVGRVIQGDPYPKIMGDSTSLMAFFNATEGRRKRKNIEINWIYRLFDPFDNLEYFWCGEFNSADSGTIGELAADITMQWLGFNKREAKYKGNSNNGFDGVYRKADALILSEAKLWHQAPSVDSILHTNLYAKISKRLKNLSQNGKETVANFIETFINTHPEQVYLQAYICICDGQVKSSLRPLLQVGKEVSPIKSGLETPDSGVNHMILSPISSEEDKVAALVNYMRTIGVASLAEVTDMAAKAFQKLKEEENTAVTPVSKKGP